MGAGQTAGGDAHAVAGANDDSAVSAGADICPSSHQPRTIFASAEFDRVVGHPMGSGGAGIGQGVGSLDTPVGHAVGVTSPAPAIGCSGK